MNPENSRLAFFGTPDFAVPTLKALVGAGWRPEVVISQPSKPVGRGRVLTPPPVVVEALALGLEVWQPARVRDDEFLGRFEALDLDVAVVVAFGQIFPIRLLQAPRWGCLNLHASLLPRHRGASPIQAALLAGDPETGVGIIRMVEELDAGDVFASRSLAILPQETAGELSARLSRLGADLMVHVLDRLPDLRPKPQIAQGATYAPRIGKKEGQVNWLKSATQIERQWQAMTPWPGSWSVFRGEKVRFHRVKSRESNSHRPPGEILGVDGDTLWISCFEGDLGVSELQRPGRKPSDGKAFANGARLNPGERFGDVGGS